MTALYATHTQSERKRDRKTDTHTFCFIGRTNAVKQGEHNYLSDCTENDPGLNLIFTLPRVKS